MLTAVSASPSTPFVLIRPDRDLLTAWLLLFLARGGGYGYGMSDQLREQGLDVEMTVAYRVLRGLERDGHLSSRWIDGGQGPRRRMYSLTGKGRRKLDALVPHVTRNRDRYHRFVRVHNDAGHRHAARGASPSPSDAGAGTSMVHPDRDLLRGWVLLLLDGTASYGYDVRKHLATHEVSADPARIYRLLRSLDAEGCLASRWSDPVRGPQRRVYRVTPRGRRNLYGIAAVIKQACNVHDAFVGAYEELDDDYRGPAPAA